MNAEQFEKDYDTFLESGFMFIAKDQDGRWTLDEALRRLRFYTRLYIEKNNANISSVSAFKIVADALASSGEIKPIVRSEELEETVPDLTVEQYRSMPVRQIQLKYKSDPDFKRQVEQLISDGLI